MQKIVLLKRILTRELTKVFDMLAQVFGARMLSINSYLYEDLSSSRAF